MPSTKPKAECAQCAGRKPKGNRKCLPSTTNTENATTTRLISAAGTVYAALPAPLAIGLCLAATVLTHCYGLSKFYYTRLLKRC
jgi:hypothetical protein